MSDFIYYPEIDDDDFYQRIYWKKEFNKTKSTPTYYKKTPEQACNRGEFRMQGHQELVRNFISPETPYNGLLIYWGTGVGKTCGAIGIAEGLRDEVSKRGKKIYVISSSNIEPNFHKELYNNTKFLTEIETNAAAATEL